MIRKTVILVRQSVEPKYLRITTTDFHQQQLFCRRQLSTVVAVRDLKVKVAEAELQTTGCAGGSSHIP
jgi:hypothetical protein